MHLQTPTQIVLGPFTCPRLGDILCATPLPRILHQSAGVQVFISESPLNSELFRGNPYVAGFSDGGGIAPEMQATGVGHVIQQIQQGLGLPIDPLPRPEVYLDSDEREWARAQRRMLPRDRPVCLLSSSAISDRENLEQVDWERVVATLGRKYTVVQPRLKEAIISGTVVYSDLTLRKYMALFSVADLFVGGTSGGSHVAAAFDVPSLIVIWQSLQARLRFPVSGLGAKAPFLYPQHWFVAAESVGRAEFDQAQLESLVNQISTADANARPTCIGNRPESPCGFRPQPRRTIQREGRRLLRVPRAYGHG